MTKKNKVVKTESIEEALARGVKIEKLPSSDEVRKQRIEAGEIEDKPSKNVKGVPVTALNIKSIGEAIDFYGEKIRRRKKVKKPDFSEVDKTQIPKNLHYILEGEKKDVLEEEKK